MASIVSQIRPLSLKLYYYLVGGPQSEYNAIYNAPWPSGRATGIIDYNENIFFAYEHQFGCWPQYNANTGLAITNPYVLSALPNGKQQGPIIVDNYPGGLNGYITNIVNPGFISGVNTYMPGITGATYSGAFCIDFETWGPYFDPGISGASAGLPHVWRTHYNSKYGVPPGNNDEKELVYRTSLRNIYSGLMIRHIELIRQYVPNVSNVFIFNFPALQYNQFDNPSVFGYANTGNISSFNDELSPLYNSVDSLNPELYFNIAKTIQDIEFPANNRQLRYNRHFDLHKKPILEVQRISDKYQKPMIGGWFPVYNAGVTTYVGESINSLDVFMMGNISILAGFSGHYIWVATPTAMGFSNIPSIQSGMAVINQYMLGLKMKFSGLNYPSSGYSDLWDTPWPTGSGGGGGGGGGGKE